MVDLVFVGGETQNINTVSQVVGFVTLMTLFVNSVRDKNSSNILAYLGSPWLSRAISDDVRIHK